MTRCRRSDGPSMGPRLFIAEDLSSRTRDTAAFTFNGAAIIHRGRLGSAVWPWPYLAPSMGPRLFIAEDRLCVSLYFVFHPPLQWGRDYSSRKTFSYSPVIASGTALQWGRDYSSRKTRGRDECLGRCTAFNGAAIIHRGRRAKQIPAGRPRCPSMGPRLFIAEDPAWQRCWNGCRPFNGAAIIHRGRPDPRLRLSRGWIPSMGPRLFIAEDSRPRNGLCERQLQCVLRARARNRWRRVAENRLDES